MSSQIGHPQRMRITYECEQRGMEGGKAGCFLWLPLEMGGLQGQIWGAWMAQLVKPPTLGFSLWSDEIKPHLGLRTGGNLLQILSPSTPPFHVPALFSK